MTRMHAGFSGVVQHEWPRPRGWAPPQRLETLDLATLPGVGATLAKRLRTFGIRSVRDLLFHAPRRYESAVDQVPIAKLGRAEGEVAIEGRIVSARARPLRGRRTLVTAVVRDSSGGQVSASFFNQPWLAEKLVAGTSVRLRGQARPLRVRREELRHRRGAPDGRLRPRLSGERAGPVDAPAGARAHGARRARAKLSRPAAGRARARAPP